MYQVAFSTLGIPGTSLDAAIALALHSGYDGLELRCAAGEPIHPELAREERVAAVRAFRRSGITPVGIASYVKVAAPGEDGPVLTALRRHIELAADLETPHLRVFPGGGRSTTEEADSAAVRRLGAVAEDAASAGVRVLVETHDSHRGALDVARVLHQVDATAIGVLWDTMHTHLAGDSPQDAARALAPYLGYVQVKDAQVKDAQVKDMASPADLTPLALGSGTLPLAQSLTALSDIGYHGWLVWEYEALWYPGCAPLPQLLDAGRAWLADHVPT